MFSEKKKEGNTSKNEQDDVNDHLEMNLEVNQSSSSDRLNNSTVDDLLPVDVNPSMKIKKEYDEFEKEVESDVIHEESNNYMKLYPFLKVEVKIEEGNHELDNLSTRDGILQDFLPQENTVVKEEDNSCNNQDKSIDLVETINGETSDENVQIGLNDDAIELNHSITQDPLSFESGGQGTVKEIKVKGKKKEWKCNYCDRQLASFYSLKRHKMTHGTERPFRCDFCEKDFITATDLNRHMVRHTRDKNFLCAQCNKSYASLHDLKSHMSRHEKGRSFCCGTCHKPFVTASELKRHEFTHLDEKPHKCEVCDRSFVTATNLKIHLQVHTGEKPCKCNFCDKFFSNSSNLNLHIKFMHTKDRPFHCSYCEKSFVIRRDLVRHEKRHIKNNDLPV